jgi:galacturan 1,4-alpha-galacturonidase
MVANMLQTLKFCCAGLVIALPSATAHATDQIPLISVQAPETVTTTDLPSPSTLPDHWTPSDRSDPYVCEYLGENDCWQPSLPGGGAPYSHNGDWPNRGRTCVVKAGGDPKGDDAPAIIAAFDDCKSDGHIVFENTTYYVGTVLNTTGLQHVDIEVNGTLLWSDDIEYWLGASLPIGFQNQTSAWLLGGDDVHFYGHGDATFDGNGQVWYDCR